MTRSTDENPLEKVIEKKVCGYAKRKGCTTYKFTSPNQRSVPDQIILKDGHILFIEFKRYGKKPTPAQEHCHKVLAKQGFNVEVVDSVMLGRFVIDQFLGEVRANRKRFTSLSG